MFIKLNKNTKYVNFNEDYEPYEREIYSVKYISVKIYLTKYIDSYTYYTHRRLLKTKQELIYT